VLAVCSSADESLMQSLMNLHGEVAAATAPTPGASQPAAPRTKTRKR